VRIEVVRLQQVAAAASETQAPTITSDVGALQSITLELELANNGQVIESPCSTERCGVHRRKAG
jgi:hypothetical protein